MSRRVKISATVDPNLLEAVDAFLSTHSDFDRSKVIDEALRLWYAKKQQAAMKEQFASLRSPEEQEELKAWRDVQQASARRLFAKR